MSAASEATIDALTLAGALTVHVQTGSGFGLDGAGAGAGSKNTIHDTVVGYVTGSTDPAGYGVTATQGDVSVEAKDDSKIKADAVAVAVSVEVSTQGQGTTIAVGGALALNSISNTVKGYFEGSTVNGAGGVDVKATETSTIDALTVGAAAAVTVNTGSATFTGSGAGGVAISNNTISNLVLAYIKDSASRTDAIRAATGDVAVEATDTAAITAHAGGGSLSVGLGFSASGATISLGRFCWPTTWSPIRSRLISTTQRSPPPLASSKVKATSGSTFESIVVGVAVVVALQISDVPLSIAAVGVGTRATNKVQDVDSTDESGRRPRHSLISGGQVVAQKDVVVKATDTSTVTKADASRSRVPVGVIAFGRSHSSPITSTPTPCGLHRRPGDLHGWERYCQRQLGPRTFSRRTPWRWVSPWGSARRQRRDCRRH